jgi:GxxExxY protein
MPTSSRWKPFAKTEMSATCTDTEGDRAADRRIDANSIATRVINTALAIHRRIGPGRLALAYAELLVDTLGGDGLTVEPAEFIAVRLGGSRFNSCLRPPLIVGGAILVAPKCLASLSHIDRKQMLTYLKLSNLSCGLVINFGGQDLSGNIERIENQLSTRLTLRDP